MSGGPGSVLSTSAGGGSTLASPPAPARKSVPPPSSPSKSPPTSGSGSSSGGGVVNVNTATAPPPFVLPTPPLMATTSTTSSTSSSSSATSPPLQSNTPPPALTGSPTVSAAAAPSGVESLDVVRFSDDLQKAVASVMTSSDPMDTTNFNPLDYINSGFQDEKSLSALEPTIGKLALKIHHLDTDIVAAVREQSKSQARGRKDLASAMKNVDELFSKVEDIKKKAEASEAMATKICCQIRSLDYAKKNLTLAIRTLKRVQMMVSSRDQVKFMLSQKQYADAAKKLEVVTLLSAEFEQYNQIPKIASILHSIASLKDEVYKCGLDEFNLFFGSKATAIEKLLDVCLMAESLGPVKLKEFQQWLCDTMLTSYREMFPPASETARLENVEKRYKWLDTHLTTNAATYNKIFPQDWNIFMLIAEEFCCVTRLELMGILEANREFLVIKVLVEALQKTITFEKQLRKDFECEEEEVIEDNEEYLDETAKEKEPAVAPPPVKFKRVISSCFDPYMDLYVSQEDKNIAKFISNSLSEEKWTVEEENDQKVLNSSTDIVYYLRTSMKRCMELSDGQPLFELNGVFKRHIRSYASALSAKIPPENGRLTAREIELCGIIVNTAEYLRLRTEQMGALWRRRISFKFKEKVDMSAEQNELKANCISKGVRTLSTLLNCKLEPFLVDMTKQPWATMADTQTDQSTYVTNIMTTLASDAPEIVKWLVNHYGFFCDLFVGSFCPELINCIFKCKRISENGAQSLLLDMAAIRTALLQLPNVTATPVNPFGDAQPERKEKKANNRFIKFVNGQMSKAELILKVAGAPQETCIETYLALVQAPSDEEFQKIIELKGLKGPDRQYLVDKFNRAADQARLTAATSTTSASSTATPANTSRQPQAAPTSGSITLPSLIGPSSASTAAAAAASSAATAASSAAAATSQGAQAAIRTMTGLFDRMRANLGNAED